MWIFLAGDTDKMVGMDSQKKKITEPFFFSRQRRQVPPNKVVVMLDRQAPTYSKIVSEVSEEKGIMDIFSW